MRRLPSGRITTHYDPAIVRQMFAHPRDYEQWEHWDQIDAPTLVLRGVESDLLLCDTARQMAVRGPRAVIVEIESCGHAPALNVESQNQNRARIPNGVSDEPALAPQNLTSASYWMRANRRIRCSERVRYWHLATWPRTIVTAPP